MASKKKYIYDNIQVKI